MSKAPIQYRDILKEMLEELEGRVWAPPAAHRNLVIALAVTQELQHIADHLEDLNLNVVAVGNNLLGRLHAHEDATAKALARIAAEIPLAGKGP